MRIAHDRVTRRAVLRMMAAAAVPSFGGHVTDAQAKRADAGVVMDHLLLGAADLDRGIEWVERQTGVRAVVGGSHPGRGTRNALLSLGPKQYLEIFAPDPAQGLPHLTRSLSGLTEPRLIGWAAASGDIDALAKDLRGRGLEVSGPRDGSRARPDGKVLQWRTLGVPSSFGDGEVDPIPFFIQWAAGSVHPSQDSPKGCELTALEFGHHEPDALRKAFFQIGIEAAVSLLRRPRLAATLMTPKGRMTIA